MITRVIDGLLFKIKSPSELIYVGYDDQIFLIYTEFKNWCLNIGVNKNYFSTQKNAITALKMALDIAETKQG